MNLEIIFWKINKNSHPLQLLRDAVNKHVISSWQDIDSVDSKIWIENENEGWWGAIIIWKNKKPSLTELPPNLSLEIIKRPPDVRLQFTIAARTCKN